MSWVTSAAVFVIIWWLVLFMVLPWGVAGGLDAADVAKGQDAGAPRKPRLWLKLAITTLVAAVLFGLFYWVAESGLVSFRD
ncbi:MAG: DUF1467 family protein [Rhodospirillales bacterium]|nr:DUF1467 family protein [Rhodospirillales bacterium]